MRQWIKELFLGRYTTLLTLIILLFAFRPYVNHIAYLAFWKLILTGTLCSAIFNCNHKKPIRITISLLAIPAVLLSWLNLLYLTPLLFLTNTVITIIFMTICTVSIIYDVLLRARVTYETLRGVACAYFLVAFLFAYVYYLIEFMHPGAIPVFHSTQTFSYTYSLSDVLYYSFITLLTFGDVNAHNSTAQTAIVLEGMIGQFYMAIIVAKIVSVYALSPERILQVLKKTKEEL